MPRRLIRLIYFSKQAIPHEDIDSEIDAIIRASVRNNMTSGVTGLLLAHRGWFLQALEGEPVAVQTTYGRIVNDRRHAESHVLTAMPIEGRMFGAWEMCARRLTTEDEAILGVLDAKSAFDPARFDAKAALRLLMAVRNIRGRLRSEAQSASRAAQGLVKRL